MKKVLSILKYVLLAVSLLAVILVGVQGDSGVDFMLTWAYILLGIAVVVTIVLPLVNLAQNPKGALRSLIGLAVVVVVIGIAYAMSSAETIVTPVDVFDKPGELKLTDTGLYTTYFALGLAIVVAILGEIRNSFK